MKHLSIFKFLLFFLVWSCAQRSTIGEEDISQIAIDPQESLELNFSDFFDTTLIVPLEVTANSLIGEVSKVITTEEYIYVLDRTVAESLFVFNYKGKLLRFFSGTGGGPGEFIRISNFFLSKNKNLIYIQDHSLSKIVAFDLNGTFIFEKKFEFSESFNDMIAFEDGLLIVKPTHDNLGVELGYLSLDLNMVEVPFQLEKNNFKIEAGFKHQFFYPGNEGKIFFKEVLSKNLYSITPEDVSIYAFNFPADRVFSLATLPWNDDNSSIHMSKLYQEIQNNGLLNLGDQVLELDSLILINFYEGRNIKLIAYNKLDKTAKIVTGFENDLDGVVKNLPGIFPTNYHSNEMIIDLTPNDIYSSMGDLADQNPYLDYLKKIMPQLEENPVLFIYRKKSK